MTSASIQCTDGTCYIHAFSMVDMRTSGVSDFDAEGKKLSLKIGAYYTLNLKLRFFLTLLLRGGVACKTGFKV